MFLLSIFVVTLLITLVKFSLRANPFLYISLNSGLINIFLFYTRWLLFENFNDLQKKLLKLKRTLLRQKTKMLKILKIEYKQKGVKLNCLLLKQEKELTSPIFCHFIQQNLNISRAITEENSPLHIGRNRTQIMNFWFPSTSR